MEGTLCGGSTLQSQCLEGRNRPIYLCELEGSLVPVASS